MLCSAMVIIVLSVMGGWLRMFRTQFKGISGDIIITTPTMTGFAGYEKMLDEIRLLPEVKAAAPVVQTYGLININNNYRDGVQVVGYPPEIQQVNSFRTSCNLMGGNFQGVLAAQNRAKDILASPDPVKAALDPARVAELPDSALGILSNGKYYPFSLSGSDQAKFYLKTPGATPRVRLFADVDDFNKPIIEAGNTIRPLYFTPEDELQFKLWNNHAYSSPGVFKGDPRSWGAMVVGSGVIGLRKDENGVIKRPSYLLDIYADLTVLPISVDSANIDLSAKQRGFFWIVDDSRTGVWVYDSHNVYVDFSRLQRDLQMDAHDGAPARCHQIQIALKPDASAGAVRDKVESIVRRVNVPELKNLYRLDVKTWDEQHAGYIGVVEKEKGMLAFLFGIISIVAVFLIFCIFYMIVAEKTRDIGILKSLGATRRGVAAIFLGYGAVIGLVGAFSGLIIAWLIVHNINEIHTFLGKKFGLVVWDPQFYIFDTIPNTMNPPEVIVIMLIAVLSAVIGSAIPAYRASNLDPVEALRWE